MCVCLTTKSNEWEGAHTCALNNRAKRAGGAGGMCVCVCQTTKPNEPRGEGPYVCSKQPSQTSGGSRGHVCVCVPNNQAKRAEGRGPIRVHQTTKPNEPMGRGQAARVPNQLRTTLHCASLAQARGLYATAHNTIQLHAISAFYCVSAHLHSPDFRELSLHAASMSPARHAGCT